MIRNKWETLRGRHQQAWSNHQLEGITELFTIVNNNIHHIAKKKVFYLQTSNWTYVLMVLLCDTLLS